MKKAVGYVRTATKVAPKEFNSIENQERQIKGYCQKNDIELVKVYSDPAKSGIRLNRPALNRLLRKAKKTPVDYVVITDSDRLSRNILGFLKTKRLLKKAGVEIICVNHVPAKTDSYETFFGEILAAVNVLHPRIMAARRHHRNNKCNNA